ncbi:MULTISPECIES: PspC domain-containing protein [Acinetobacter]|mgnify:CR=1 FL=1|jgi:phage shock protein PspC (stress-responsive transcriptional regulator)|uniref:PspC domain-containing protein n=2 Tax=Acinetobacter TaxID=469 RepID=A0A4Q7B128_9GAMM|nr:MULTISPECIES: PspC domain-containing protein [Acinetobacter]MCW8039576.1 PspC domain-containing protein [Acinetobacter entericus]QXW25708.1 PspC domain-containing protein [Acinetobacter johnsonii]RZG69914.1 PspC domain-containing protein [Acinetobacter bouvetii]TCB74957.1 PspC domain-containing protein [Acinetobacter sp. ANC 4177]
MANVGLYRSNRSNMIAGVMGGIAERFGWNVTLLRIIFVIISCMSAAFPGILVYLVLWLVMPKQSTAYKNTQGYKNPVRTVNDDPLS